MNVAVDIIYIRMTRRFDASRTLKTFKKLNFDVFYEELLKLMARLKYPKLPLSEAEVRGSQDRLFEKWIYPNLVHNLPYLGVQDRPKYGGLKINPLLALINPSAGIASDHKAAPSIGEPKPESSPPVLNMFKLFSAPSTTPKANQPLKVKDLDVSEHDSNLNDGKGILVEETREKGVDQGVTMGLYHSQSVEDLVADNGVDSASRIDPGSTETPQPTFTEQLDMQINRLLGAFSNKIAGCLRCLQTLVTLLSKCLFPFNIQAETELNSVLQSVPESEPSDQSGLRKASPDWPELCHIIVTSLSTFLEEGRKVLNSKPIQKMDLNSENLIAIFSHVTDVVSFASIAFVREVGWSNSSNVASNSSQVVLSESSYWDTEYWICFGFCIAFAIISIPAVRLTKAGHFGITKDMRPVPALSWQGLLSRAVSLLAVSGYITIMKTMLGALSCAYDQTGLRWYLITNSSIECFSPTHSVYFVLAVLAICLYYPLATLLYPNIQYQNKGLDLKYDTTFIVLEAQGKLTIAGFAAFLPRAKYLKLQLIVGICVCLLLGMTAAKMKPCMVKSYNLWKVGGYAVAAWCSFWALLNVLFDGHVFCLILLVTGVGGIAVILGILQYTLYGWTFRAAKLRLPGDLEPPQDAVGIKHQNSIRVIPSLVAQTGAPNPFEEAQGSR